jgi:hypothetical protein
VAISPDQEASSGFRELIEAVREFERLDNEQYLI